MTIEFQVLYRHVQNPGTAAAVPVGDVLTVLAVADAADQLKAQFEADGFHVLAVNEVRPVVDWSKPNFDRDEAAVFCGVEPITLSTKKGDGEIPFSAFGRGRYPRRLLEKFIENKLNPAGKKLAAQVEAAS